MTRYTATRTAWLSERNLPDDWTATIARITLGPIPAAADGDANVRLEIHVDADSETDARRAVETQCAFLQALLRERADVALERFDHIQLSWPVNGAHAGSVCVGASATIATRDFPATIAITNNATKLSTLQTLAVPEPHPVDPPAILLAGRALQQSYAALTAAERVLFAWFGAEALALDLVGAPADGQEPVCQACRKITHTPQLRAVRDALLKVYAQHHDVVTSASSKHPRFSKSTVEEFLQRCYGARNSIAHRARTDLDSRQRATEAQELLGDLLEEALQIPIAERKWRIYHHLDTIHTAKHA